MVPGGALATTPCAAAIVNPLGDECAAERQADRSQPPQCACSDRADRRAFHAIVAVAAIDLAADQRADQLADHWASPALPPVS